MNPLILSVQLSRRSFLGRGGAAALALTAECCLASPLIQTYSAELAFAARDVGMWGTQSEQSVAVSRSIGFERSGSIGGLGSLGVRLSGDVGASLNLNYRASLGSADIAQAGRLQTSLPLTASVGSAVTVSSAYTPTSGEIRTYSPQLTANINANAHAGARLEAAGRTIAHPHVDRTWTLLNVDSGGPSRSWDARFGSLTVSPVRVDTIGSLQPDGTIRSSGRDDFLTARADIDAIITATTGIPFGYDRSFNLGLLRGHVDASLLDLELGFSMGIGQDFEFQGAVMASYALEDGRTVVAPANEAITFVIPEGDWGSEFEINATYVMEGDLHNNTDLTLEAFVDLEMLEASGDLSARLPRCSVRRLRLRCGMEWTRIFRGSFGPLIDETWSLFDGSIGLFDRRFAVAGFNTISTHYGIALGDSAFAASRLADGAVPEPAPVALIGLALLIMSALRRGGLANGAHMQAAAA
jgi:hypothetical protein